MDIIFDDWQQTVIDYEGSVTIRAGRQVGKSTTVGKRIKDFAFKYAPCIQLITAPSQRQSSQLFIKTMGWLYEEHVKSIDRAGGYKDDPGVSLRRNEELRRIFDKKHGIFEEIPTKTQVVLKNGSIIYALPAGKTGAYLRTFALDFLHIDEAAYVPDTVYTALRPMLAISAKKRGLGWETLLSTPFGKGGFFYDSHTSDEYMQFHVNSEDCPRYDAGFLLKEKKRLSKIEYAQEYLGEFIDEFQQYFSTKLIKSRMNFFRWNFKDNYSHVLRYYYGHDYAGPGKDENASVIAEMQRNSRLKIVMPEVDDEPNTSKINYKIAHKDSSYNFVKLFVDSGGFGCGPTNELRKLLGRKVIGLDNSKKSIDKEGRTGKILKEDLYSNAKSMMERGDVDIVDDLKLLRSLKSMTFEYTADKRLKIYGKYSHLAEAFVRACWAVNEKGLDLYVC